jgi:ankyrin repeat protein
MWKNDMKKTEKQDNSKIAYLYLLIAAGLILIPLLLIWHGTPDDRLLKAVKRCDRSAAQRELENGANVNVKTTEDDMVDKAPILFIAARNGCAEIVQLLLDSKADINAQAAGRLYPGWTALLAATEKGHTNIVQILLEHGANVNVTIAEGDKKGWTALKCAEAASHADIVRLLKAAGAK